MSDGKIFRRGSETVLSGFETESDVQKHLKMIREDPRFKSAIAVHGEIHVEGNHVIEFEQLLAKK